MYTIWRVVSLFFEIHSFMGSRSQCLSGIWKDQRVQYNFAISVYNLDQFHSFFPFEIRGSFVYFIYIMCLMVVAFVKRRAMEIMDYQFVKKCGDILDSAFPV